MKRAFYAAIWAIIVGGCSAPEPHESIPDALYQQENFKTYWYSGKAEISSYRLSQSRYGENREGKAVLIFVMEDFSRNKLVKLDDPEQAGRDKVSVLKMNFTKNFVTGIYPYSMMLSVFTPVDRQANDNTMKITMSSQEWCGQVFAQLMLRGHHQYDFTGHSYFEKEGEETRLISDNHLEDEMWTLARLDPRLLPEGTFDVLPGLFYARLKHENLVPQKATAQKVTAGDTIKYSIAYAENQRTLQLKIDSRFPHPVLGWVETFQENGKTQVTKAVRERVLITDYWTKNKNLYLNLRDSLGLSPHNY